MPGRERVFEHRSRHDLLLRMARLGIVAIAAHAAQRGKLDLRIREPGLQGLEGGVIDRFPEVGIEDLYRIQVLGLGFRHAAYDQVPAWRHPRGDEERGREAAAAGAVPGERDVFHHRAGRIQHTQDRELVVHGIAELDIPAIPQQRRVPHHGRGVPRGPGPHVLAGQLVVEEPDVLPAQPVDRGRSQTVRRPHQPHVSGRCTHPQAAARPGGRVFGRPADGVVAIPSDQLEVERLVAIGLLDALERRVGMLGILVAFDQGQLLAVFGEVEVEVAVHVEGVIPGAGPARFVPRHGHR